MRKILNSFIYLSLLTTLFACQARPVALIPPAQQMRSLRAQNIDAANWGAFLEDNQRFLFQEHDHNGDGVLQSAEVPHLGPSFSENDKNQNGVLEPEEVQMPPEVQTRILKQLQEHIQPPKTPEMSIFEDPGLEALPTPTELRAFRQTLQGPQSFEDRKFATPVLLVPGYAEPSWYFMYGIYKNLKKHGWAVEGINLFPNFATAQEQAAKVKERVEEMKQRYGVSQVHIVAHSFGGLISRYYMQEMNGLESVHELVTVATPHHGTYLAYLGIGKSTFQMVPGSDFLKALNANGFVYDPAEYMSIWSNLDEIVWPQKHAQMPDSDIRYVPWTGHLTIMFSQRTYGHIREALQN